jgi:hypothetical protein
MDNRNNNVVKSNEIEEIALKILNVDILVSDL